MTAELPSAINPGTKTGKIKGAVLAFEISKVPIYKICEIVELMALKKEGSKTTGSKTIKI
jgi:hypothetical protein